MYSLKRESWSTKTMVKVSVLSVISFVLMLLEFPVLFLAPPFIKFDFSDLPALIGAFALGPMAGVIIQFLKNILNLIIDGTTTGAVGEFANFVVGSAFAYTAGIFYYKHKTFKNAIIGLVAGTIVMTITITLANYYIMFPFYAKLMGQPIQAFIDMGSKVSSKIVDLKTLMLYSIVPFNLLKGSVLTAVTILIYKKVSPILHK